MADLGRYYDDPFTPSREIDQEEYRRILDSYAFILKSCEIYSTRFTSDDIFAKYSEEGKSEPKYPCNVHSGGTEESK